MVGRIVVAGLVGVGMAAGQATAPATATPAKAYTFEVVSIRQNNTPIRLMKGPPEIGPTADGYRMINSESEQLLKDIVPVFRARMPKGHSTGDHVKGNPAEAAAYPDSDVAGIRVLEPPSRDQDPEVLVAPDQVVSNDENGTPQVVVGVSHQRSVGMINLVALVPRRAQAGSASNRSRLGIMLDRTHLTCELGRRDDIDPGDTHKQNIGSLAQGFHQIALDRLDQLQLGAAVGIELGEKSAME